MRIDGGNYKINPIPFITARQRYVPKYSLRGFSALGCRKGLSDQSQNLAMITKQNFSP